MANSRNQKVFLLSLFFALVCLVSVPAKQIGTHVFSENNLKLFSSYSGPVNVLLETKGNLTSPVLSFASDGQIEISKLVSISTGQVSINNLTQINSPVTVTIAVPSGFSFSTLELNLCDNPGTIELGGFTVDTLIICSSGESIIVSKIHLAPSSAIVINAPRADVGLTFAAAFRGAYAIRSSDETSLLHKNFCEPLSETEGECGEGNATLTVFSKNASVDFQSYKVREKRAVSPSHTKSKSRSRSKTRSKSRTATPTRTPSITRSACPTGNPNSPTSAAVPTTWNLPAIIHPTISGSTSLTVGYGSSINRTSAISFTASVKSYAIDDFIVLQGPASGSLIGDQPYRLTFTLQADPTNQWNVTGTVSTIPTKVHVFVGTNMTYANRYYWSSFSTSYTCSRECSPLGYSLVHNTALGAAARTFSVDFTTTGSRLNHNITIGFRLDSAWTVKGNRLNSYTFSNVFFTRLARTRTLGTPLTAPSAFLPDLKEMPALPANSFTQQSSCPHNRADLKRWQAASTWGGTVPPVNGSPITIPANTKVLIDGCSFNGQTWTLPLGTITIPEGSELVIGEGVGRLKITNIVVRGHLWIGGPTCRLRSKLNITISSTASDLGGVCGGRTICASGKGEIDIHGKLYDATWSRLASHAYAGDDRVQVQSVINWEVGQQVVITATTYNNSADNHQFELRTIAAIEGKRIRFTQPLKFFHYGGPDYQAEVGLLTRRIIIQGDAATEVTKIGGHIISAGPQASLRIRGVLGYRMGQRNQMARYPFHFHMMGSSPNSYITDCAVYWSYYRCFTIHGTNDSLVSRNVAYHNHGHCYYLEDGVEENNKIRFNLAAYQIPIWATPGVPTNFANPAAVQEGLQLDQNTNLLVPADVSAGGFYITNAFNEIVGNVGCGGFAGFSFVNLLTPIGSHRARLGLVPKDRTTLKFSGNGCHSASWHWEFSGCIYVGGQLWYQNTTTPLLTYRVGRVVSNTRKTAFHDGTPAWLQFNTTQVYQSRMSVSHWGDRLEVINLEATDVARSTQIFGESWMDNAIINVNSSNPAQKPADVLKLTEGFQYYDTSSRAIITRIKFMNFNRPTDWVISTLTHSDKFKPQGIAAAKAITFENCNLARRILQRTRGTNQATDPPTGSSRYFNIMDFDGSIMGTSGRTLIGASNTEYTFFNQSHTGVVDQWWKLSPSCVQGDLNWNVWGCVVKDWRYQVASILLYVPGLIDKDVTINDYTDYAGKLTRFGGVGKTIVTRNAGITGPTGPGIGWFLQLHKGAPSQFSISATRIPWVPEISDYTYLPFSIPYPNNLVASNFEITWRSYSWSSRLWNVTAAGSLSELWSDPVGRKFFYESGTGLLYFKLMAEWVSGSIGITDTTILAEKNYASGGCRLYDSTSSSYEVRLLSCTGCEVLSSGVTTYYRPYTATVPSKAVLPW